MDSILFLNFDCAITQSSNPTNRLIFCYFLIDQELAYDFLRKSLFLNENLRICKILTYALCNVISAFVFNHILFTMFSLLLILIFLISKDLVQYANYNEYYMVILYIHGYLLLWHFFNMFLLSFLIPVVSLMTFHGLGYMVHLLLCNRLQSVTKGAFCLCLYTSPQFQSTLLGR